MSAVIVVMRGRCLGSPMSPGLVHRGLGGHHVGTGHGRLHDQRAGRSDNMEVERLGELPQSGLRRVRVACQHPFRGRRGRPGVGAIAFHDEGPRVGVDDARPLRDVAPVVRRTSRGPAPLKAHPAPFDGESVGPDRDGVDAGVGETPSPPNRATRYAVRLHSFPQVASSEANRPQGSGGPLSDEPHAPRPARALRMLSPGIRRGAPGRRRAALLDGPPIGDVRTATTAAARRGDRRPEPTVGDPRRYPGDHSKYGRPRSRGTRAPSVEPPAGTRRPRCGGSTRCGRICSAT